MKQKKLNVPDRPTHKNYRKKGKQMEEIGAKQEEERGREEERKKEKEGEEKKSKTLRREKISVNAKLRPMTDRLRIRY